MAKTKNNSCIPAKIDYNLKQAAKAAKTNLVE